MPRLTITITDEQSDLLDELSGDSGPYESKSEAVRDFIQQSQPESRHEHTGTQDELQRVRAEYEDRIAELETELERTKREKRQILDLRDDHSELVAAEQRKQSRADRWAKAGWWTKLKWSARGMPDEE